MNSRERILAAIRHKEADRIPIDPGATPSSGISVIACRNRLEYPGMEKPGCAYDVVRRIVRRNVEIFARDGGFVFNPVHNIMPDASPGNRTAMSGTAPEFRYG